MFWRRRKKDRIDAVQDDGTSPRERFEEFARENGEWHRKVEESLTELRELAGETEPLDKRSHDDATRGAEPAPS
jgi:hypothetical protein